MMFILTVPSSGTIALGNFISSVIIRENVLKDSGHYADHVLEQHCKVSACCPYCGDHVNRREMSQRYIRTRREFTSSLYRHNSRQDKVSDLNLDQ